MTTDLIVQADDIATADLKTLHQLARARDIVKVEGAGHFLHQAFRLTHCEAVETADVKAIRQYAEHAQLDCAFVAAEARFQDFGLVAMDMDSTLITIECIDEIADFAGKKAEVAAVTASAMRGEIDWPASLRQRVGALAGLPVTALEEVYEKRLALSPGAERLVAAARHSGCRLLLVSGGFTFFTERLKARLGLDFAFANELVVEQGKLTGEVSGPLCDADAKAAHVRNTASLLGLEPSAVMVIGDGANDLKMMAAAGVSVAFHAKPVVREQATYALNQVGLDGVLAIFPFIHG